MGLKEQILSWLEQQLPDIEIVDVILGKEQGQLHIQVLLDREGGVNLEFLTKQNRVVGEILDVKDIPGPYLLEVSSAGLERPLVRPENYQRFSGRKATLTLKEPVNNTKTLTGVLAGLQEDGQIVIIEVNGSQLHVPYTNITKAHLVFEF